MRRPPAPALSARGVVGIPEIEPGADLAMTIGRCLQRDGTPLEDGDVVVVTSKVVSKAEGRVARMEREAAVAAETTRVVARRGPTTIARTRQGLTLAAAGVDASNVAPGSVVLLPEDPDASARQLRDALRRATGRTVAVVISDTAGRTWREGQTDIAIGLAGMPGLVSLAGRVDDHGNALEVTMPAVADEVAGLADLVMGKLSAVPVVVVRGLADLVLRTGAEEAGGNETGAAALVRADAGDMFGLGSREAVLAAVTRSDDAALAALRRDRTDVDELVRLATRNDVPAGLETRMLAAARVEVSGADDLPTAAALERLVIAATVTRWDVVEDGRNTGRCRIVIESNDHGP